MTQVTHTPHNPDYKLVSISQATKTGWIELVYGITNTGENEGLEVYHHKPNELHHYQSFRYPGADVPAKYRSMFVTLRKHAREGDVKDGYKLNLGVNEGRLHPLHDLFA